jgi:hypothetical protein
MCIGPLAAAVLLLAAPLGAQARPDSLPLRARPSPLGYFARSMLIPGWGQAALDRKLSGGLFVAFEGVAVGMALKAHHEMRYLERTGSGRLESKRAERGDWLFLIAVNHLFAGMEAYVSANLYDFPGELQARVLPGGRRSLGITLPFPR